MKSADCSSDSHWSTSKKTGGQEVKRKTIGFLHLIDEIVGEFHEIGGPFLEISEDRPPKAPVFYTDRVARFTLDELVRTLQEAGFHVTHCRHRRPDGALEGLGLFFAAREPGQVQGPP